MDRLVFLIVVTCFAAAQGNSGCLSEHMKTIDSWGYATHSNYLGEELRGNEFVPWMQPFTKHLEAEINKQIYRELFAHYTYMSMAFHFQRADINLPGFSKFFKESAEEELKHAHMFMEYQNKRGGHIKFQNLVKPCKNKWGSGLRAMTEAFHLEKEITMGLQELHTFAANSSDAQMQDFIESNFLGEQVESIKELSNYINTLKRMRDDPLGEYQFDKLTLGGK